MEFFDEQMGDVSISPTASGIIRETQTFYNLSFKGGGTVEMHSNLDVDGTLDINGPTLDVTGSLWQLNVAQGFANAGVFIARTGTVEFDGVGYQEITTNNTTFENLIVTNGSGSTVAFVDAFTTAKFTDVTPNSVLTFGAGTTVNITGELDLNGQATGTPIILDSSDGTTRFTFNVTGGTQEVQYLNVSNSESSTNDIRARNSVEGANTDSSEASPRWIFGPLRGAVIMVD